MGSISESCICTERSTQQCRYTICERRK